MPKRTKSRRDVLKLAGVGVGAGLAGCSGGDGGDGGSGGDGGGGGGGDGSSGDGGDSMTDTPTDTPASSDGGSGSSSPDVTIRFASGYPDTESYPTGQKNFKRRVEDMSDGAIEIKLFPNGELGSDLEIAQKAQLGSLQMCHTTISNLSSYVSKLNLKNLPGLAASFDQGKRLYGSDAWNNIMNQPLRTNGFEPLGSWVFDFRHIGVNEGVTDDGFRVPADGEGVKVRVAGSQINRKMFEECGSNVVNVAWTESASAMKEGVFDGIHISRLAHCSYGFSKWESHVTNPNMVNASHTWNINAGFFRSLDQTYQDILKEAAAEQIVENRELRNSQLQKAEQCIKDNGCELVKLSNSERQKWIDAVGYVSEIWDPFISDYNASREDVEALAQAARE